MFRLFELKVLQRHQKISKRKQAKVSMEAYLVNTSSTSVDENERELTTLMSFSNEYVQFLMNHYLVPLQMLGLVGNVMVFLVAKYMVTVEKKIG